MENFLIIGNPVKTVQDAAQQTTAIQEIIHTKNLSATLVVKNGSSSF